MLSPLTGMRSRAARAVRRALSLDLVNALCVVVLGIGAVALVYGILHRSFDYDELEHFHAAWLVRRGAKPFYDFFECHPPFFWYPMSLFFRVFGDSYNLLYVFRFIAALGQIAFLVGVVKNVALSLRNLPTPVVLPARVGALAIGFVVLHPAIFEYLLEFRIDSWPNAILVIAIYRYRSSTKDALRASIELAALSMAAVLCSPKLMVLAALFTVLSLIADDQRLVRAAGMLAGGAGVLALAAGLLRLAGLHPIHVYRLSLFFHQMLNTKGGFDHGLAEIIWGHSLARNVLLASVIAWPLVTWRRFHRASFEIAVLGFLALQLRLVSFPYKQYYAPWYMLAVTFLPYLEVLFRRVRLLSSLLLAAAFLYAGMNSLDVYHGYEDRLDGPTSIKSRKELEALVPPGGWIVGAIEQMPMFRRNVFYTLINSFAPNGYGTARIMQDLKIDPFSKEFTDENHRRDIEARRPDLIVLQAALTPMQRKATEEYVAKHGSEYTRRPGPYGEMLVRKH